MTMRTLPQTATDDEIRKLVTEWSETIARGDFRDALDMFPYEGDWSADLLKKTIQGYGVPEHGETLIQMLDDWKVDEFRITSLFDGEDAEDFIRKAIDVDMENLYGLDPERYLGMVHYGDIPLSGHVSDLTARFRIKKVGDDELTLELLDVHIM